MNSLHLSPRDDFRSTRAKYESSPENFETINWDGFLALTFAKEKETESAPKDLQSLIEEIYTPKFLQSTFGTPNKSSTTITEILKLNNLAYNCNQSTLLFVKQNDEFIHTVTKLSRLQF